MSTNCIGAGTTNTGLNFVSEELNEWREQAKEEGKSLNAIIKELAVEGMRHRNAPRAQRIESIRAERLRMKHGRFTAASVLVWIGLGIYAAAPLTQPGILFRRPQPQPVNN